MSEEEQEEHSKYQTFLIFGAPGSGKGTQGRILGQTPRFYHCACGDVFRSLDTRTDIGQEFVQYSYDLEHLMDLKLYLLVYHLLDKAYLQLDIF